MKVSIVTVTALIASFGTTAAWKCTCSNADFTYSNCVALGHTYGTSGCGFAACCLAIWEIDYFRDQCNRFGGGFGECRDCQSC